MPAWAVPQKGRSRGAQLPPFDDLLRIHSLRPDGTRPAPVSRQTHPKSAAGPAARLFGSYRGPYWLVDDPRPGLYSADAAGGSRSRVADLPALPEPFGVLADGVVAYLLPGRAALFLVAPDGARAKELNLPGQPLAAALSPEGTRAAVLVEARMRTVVLGNQAWFTEGSDLLLVDLATEGATSMAYPLLPAQLKDGGGLEHYAGSGAAAITWRGGGELLVSSAPGVWSLRLDDTSQSQLVVPRAAGQPSPDGLAVSKDSSLLAFTCGGRILLRDLTSGQEKDLTPAGVLVGGAHHPCWMEPSGGM